jgi:heme exporter protein C
MGAGGMGILVDLGCSSNNNPLMLWLIYVSYFMVRKFGSSSGSQVICPVLAIFGFCDMPIVYMSTQWWRTQHPAPVFGGGANSGGAADMQGAVWSNVAAWVAWGVLIVSVRYAVERRRQEQAEAEAMRVIRTLNYKGALHG